MKRKISIPILGFTTGGDSRSISISVSAEPFAIERDDRSATAPRHRGLIAKRSMADLFIAELRQAHREGRP